MSRPFDATLKEILGQSASDLKPAFGLPAIEPARLLNVDLSTLSAATDVAFGFGDPLQEIVELNFQSGPDANVPARLRLYNAAFHLKSGVPVQSILVPLRPKAETKGLNGKLEYICNGKRVLFEYDVVRMWERPIDPFLHGSPSLLPLAPLCKMPDDIDLNESLRNVVREIDSRPAQLSDRNQAIRLMTPAFILTGLRVEKKSLPGIYDGVRIMHE